MGDLGPNGWIRYSHNVTIEQLAGYLRDVVSAAGLPDPLVDLVHAVGFDSSILNSPPFKRCNTKLLILLKVFLSYGRLTDKVCEALRPLSQQQKESIQLSDGDTKEVQQKCGVHLGRNTTESVPRLQN